MQMSFQTYTRAARPLALAALSLAIVGALAAPRSAEASAFQLKEDSVQAMGRAYAGSATAGNDASVIANAPAAMADLKGTYFQADVTGVNFSAKFNGSAHDALGRPIAGGNGGDAGTTLPIPAFYASTQLGDRWHIGLAGTVPFGFQTEYDNNFVGRYNALKTKLASYDVTLSASFNVTDDFALGVSAIAQKTTAELSSAVNYNAVGLGLVNQAAAGGLLSPVQAAGLAQQLGAVVPPGSDGRARVKGDDWAYGWQAGAYWKLTPNDRFSFNWHSQIRHHIDGTANFTMPTNVQAVLASPTVAPILGALGGTPFVHTNGTAALTTPATATFSYWHQDQKFGIGMDLAWTKWDVLKNLTVNYANPVQPATVEEFNYKNTVFASIGADWYLTEKWTLRGGIGVDVSPTGAQFRDARVPDSTRKELAFGVGYQATDNFSVNASYMHIFVNKAHLNGSVSSTDDVLAGNFDDYGNTFGIQAQYHF